MNEELPNTRLVKLSNGDWIKPEMVASIRKLAIYYSSVTQTLHGPRYEVGMVGGMNIVIECGDAEEVSRQVDELSSKINNA